MDMATKSTKDYAQFKFLIDNRKTARNHINRLKDAISRKPEILAVQPILVNEKLEIIDGQHRLSAAQELNLPVHYSVVKGLDINTARDLNILQRRWNIDDFAHSYAKAGNDNYVLFNKYRGEYPGLTATVLQLVLGGGEGSQMSADFRTGKFVIIRQEEDIKELLDDLSKIRQITGHEVPLNKSFVSALLQAQKNEEFTLDEFMVKLQSRPDLFHRTSTVRDGLRMLEDIYNYKKSTNLIRLY
jgi:hypothetical protein